MEHCNLSLVEAAKGIQSGGLSSEAYVASLCDQARRHADLNVFIHFDEEQLLQDAREADAIRASGSAIGPLHGVPLAIKDCIDIASLPTTGGTPSLKNNVVNRTAPIVTKLFEAGALMMGKTNLHELAFGITSSNEHFGAVPNPVNPDRSAGGSSSGSAAAVAARIVPASLGTDTAGSVRIPAAHCGVYGFRPSHGRYESTGVMPLFPSRDTPGLFARSPDDLILLDSVLSGDWRTPAKDGAGLRIGVPGDYFFSDLEDDVARATEAEFRRLEACGFVLVEAPPPDFSAVVSETVGPIRAWELPRSLAAYLDACGNGITFDDLIAGIAGAYVQEEFADALADIDGPDLEENYRAVINRILPRHRAEYAAYFRQNNLDAIAFPTVPMVATKLGDNVKTVLNGRPISIWHTMRNTLPATFYGAPGVTVPFARSSAGLPIGLEFDGARGADREVLHIAETWAGTTR